MAKKKGIHYDLLTERERAGIRNNKGKYPAFPDDSYKTAKDRIDNFYYQGQIEKWQERLRSQEKN